MNIMINEDRAWEQNHDGTWSWAVPMPLLQGVRKVCRCGEKFWKMSSYVEHYKDKHTDGLAYNRSPAGMMVSYRTHRGTENKENYYEPY